MWYIYALLGPAIWALLNHLDKYLLGRFLKEDAAGPVLVVFIGFAGIVVAIAILLFGFPVLTLAPRQSFSVMVAGALLVASCIPYMIATQRQEASIVASLYRLVPVFVFVLSYTVLGETLQPKQILGGCVTITGAILLVVDLDKRGRGFDLVTFCLTGVARLDLLREGMDVAEAALEEATDAHFGTDGQMHTYLRLEAQTWKAR